MPTALSIVQRLHEHRAWANEKLLAAADSLAHDQLHRQFEIGQGSVWRTLLHMYGAEYLWLETLLGNDDPLCPGDIRGQLTGNQQGENPITSLAELRRRWTALEARWQEHLAGLTVDALDEPVRRRRSFVSGDQPFIIRRSDALIHVCLHAQYTLAQTVNMLRHLGVEKLPARMLSELAWEQRGQ